jgi:adenylosuccinate lyase
MRSNLDASFGLVFSQPVLLALVQGGLARDVAYGIVQESAARAWGEKRSFRDLLDNDPRVTASTQLLDEAFDLQRSLRHSGAVFDALDTVDCGDAV